jgi:predicted MFS family arabinose efflux permease
MARSDLLGPIAQDGRAPRRWAGWFQREAQGSVAGLTDRLGGPARRRAVLLLAAVLGLSGADTSAVGAVAAKLEPAFHIGTTKLGLLVTVSSLVGAIATIPVGSLTDRTRRVRLLAVSIVIWGVAEGASALATSFLSLLLIRLALGAVTATAGPTVASLTGDLFPTRDRAHMYGFIVTGELLGSGVGIVVAGVAAGWFGWRGAFVALAVPSLVLAWALYRLLPEPARGGQSRIQAGDEEILAAEEAAAHPDLHPAPAASPQATAAERGAVDAQPDEAIVVDTDPAQLTLRQAVAYVLRVRTNVILVIASSLGYFFFAGLRTFALVFARGRFHMGQQAATALIVLIGAGAVAGILIAGRASDQLQRRGRVGIRVVIGAVGNLAAAVILFPALLSTTLVVAVPLFIVGAAALSAPNPVLDAARLDIIPAQLWGRGEGVRTFLRSTLEACAPLVFGLVAAAFGGQQASFGSAASSGVGQSAVSAAQTHGLDFAFLVMLIPLAASGLLLLRARRTYPTDTASAAESERRLLLRSATTATGDHQPQ